MIQKEDRQRPEREEPAVSRSGKMQGAGHFPPLPGGRPCRHRHFSPVMLILDSGLGTVRKYLHVVLSHPGCGHELRLPQRIHTGRPRPGSCWRGARVCPGHRGVLPHRWPETPICLGGDPRGAGTRAGKGQDVGVCTSPAVVQDEAGCLRTSTPRHGANAQLPVRPMRRLRQCPRPESF